MPTIRRPTPSRWAARQHVRNDRTNPYASLFAPDPRATPDDVPSTHEPEEGATCPECGWPIVGGRCRCPGGPE